MPFRWKDHLKKLARTLLGEYGLYFIYQGPGQAEKPPSDLKNSSAFTINPVEETAIEASDDPLIREQLPYLGEGTRAFGCFLGERLVGVCVYWYGERYLQRNFWPLDAGEAKLVQIVTIPEMRGRGVAGQLISHSCQQLLLTGFSQAYARIWHSNTPSLRAFERVGWKRIALVVEINPFRSIKPQKFRIRM